MSLQTKLFAFFIAIVVVPLAFASLFGQSVIVRELERRAYSELRPAQVAATVVYQERIDGGRDRVQLVATDERFQQLLVSGDYAELQNLMKERLASGGNRLDYVIVADHAGTVLATALSPPSFLRHVSPPTAAEIVAPDLPVPRKLLFTDTRIPIKSPRGDDVAWTVIGGSYLDNEFVGSLGAKSGADASVFINGRAVASTLKRVRDAGYPVEMRLGQGQETFFKDELAGGDIYGVSSIIKAGVPVSQAALVMSNPQDPVVALRKTIRQSLIILLALALVGSAVLGYLLARVISRPIREVADGARAISEGHYDQHIDVRSRDEVGRLAETFNEMSEQLAAHIAELRISREELKRAYTRFGETLRSTHDLDSLLDVVLDTSMDTLNSKRGALLVPGAKGRMRVAVSRNTEGFDLDVGIGVAGYVAETGEAVRYPEGPEDADESDEAGYTTVLSVPLYSQEKVVAVMSLFDREDGGKFTAEDLDTLLSLSDQAGVAIENVMLHREAQHLSIMDGLTGILNRRYFQMQFEQEINRATRFAQPFSIIMLDIDNFKGINDTHGHQLGDSVLIELAKRVTAVIRDVDWFARYGGEEFVLLLPETAAEGALRTAEKIRTVVADKVFVGDTVDASVSVTISVGVSCFPTHGRERATLIRAADEALYAAKAAGKNQVVLSEVNPATVV